EGPFPSGPGPIAFFRTKYATSASTAEWFHIRWGKQPLDGSGDFDTNGAIDDYDLYFFDECVTNALMLPGCRWADMDADSDVDCNDWDLFQLAWTAPVDPPTLSVQCIGPPIPTVSTWGAVVMALLTLTAGSLVFRARSFFV
ncbi:MAG: hypothetical protein IID43_05375, partial [Planctomycetes bacterium]|nr:hypothetical protein [Planctomycetota bacterium]